MAFNIQIGGHGDLFIGDAKTIEIEVFERPATYKAGDPVDLDVWPMVDITGWAISMVVKTSVDAATATLTKTASITGTYNVTRAVNTQRAVFSLLEADTRLLSPRNYAVSIKRTTPGVGEVLGYGTLVAEKTTQA
jgi:hypothetical protein